MQLGWAVMKVILRRFLESFAIALILLSCASCANQAWQPPRPVAMRGEHMAWFNPTIEGITWMTAAVWGGTGGLLLRDGDMVYGAVGFEQTGECCFVYKQSDGASLELREENGRLLLSGKTISISSADIEASWKWLDQAPAKELQSLRFLMLPETIDENRFRILKTLAAVNPHLGLGVWLTSSSLPAAALFKPRMMLLGKAGVPAADFGRFLEGQNLLETLLLVEGIDAENLGVLATLPNLRRLAIYGDPAGTGPLPKGMRALKSLLLPNSKILDASALANVPDGIEELAIASGKLAGPGGLERFSNLRTLILDGNSDIDDLSALKGMKKLAWVGLPTKITQGQLSALVAEHPGLKIVEMIGCNEITDLSPLQGLTGLKGLVLGQYAGKLDAVEQLKSLEFLGLPSSFFDKDTKDLARIREALPRALVVPTCLGSGWILLLVPLAALVWIAGWWARGRRRTAPHGERR
jgi:hypothetical protein